MNGRLGCTPRTIGSQTLAVLPRHLRNYTRRAPTKSFEKFFGQTGVATSRTLCRVFAFETCTAPQPQPPAKHTSINQLAAEWEQDAKGRLALEEGRRWVADTF